MDNKNKGLVLIVEDDVKLLDANRLLLEAEGYEVTAAKSLSEAGERLAAQKPDIAVLDIMLPDGSGLDFLTELRRQSAVPVLLLTALGTDRDVVKGLEAGGDDYLVKPFSRGVFLARIATLLRRARSADVAEFGSLTFDMKSLTAYRSGVDMLLTKNDFALLLYLVRNENSYMKAEHLYKEVWGKDMNQDSQAIRSAASRLRAKLEGSGHTIVNERKKGYSFRIDE
jgi:DNA-binding response OmpR family regulator